MSDPVVEDDFSNDATELTSGDDGTGHEGGMFGASVMTLVWSGILCLCLSYLGVQIWFRMRRERLARASARRRLEASRAAYKNVSTSRLEAIERELVTLPVQPHCQSTHLCFGKPHPKEGTACTSCSSQSSTDIPQPGAIPTSSSSETESDVESQNSSDQQECPICFEPFTVGEVVACSPEPSTCDHVFHYECIKKWLIKNKDCPYCREPFLPFDKECEIAEVQTERLYCQTHGLVRSPRSDLKSAKISRLSPLIENSDNRSDLSHMELGEGMSPATDDSAR